MKNAVDWMVASPSPARLGAARGRGGYTAGMTQRVGAKGQVVIPKQMRDALGLQPGAEVDFERDGDSVRVMAAGAAATQGLRGRYAASGMASALLADRRREPR